MSSDLAEKEICEVNPLLEAIVIFDRTDYLTSDYFFSKLAKMGLVSQQTVRKQPRDCVYAAQSSQRTLMLAYKCCSNQLELFAF